MIKSTFFDIIKTFSQSELKQFRDFLRSPYYNKNKNIIKLFEYIRKFSSDFESGKAATALTKDNLFKKIYPGKAFNDVVMRIIMSDLIKLSQEFLTLKGLKNNPFDESLFLLQELNKKGIDKLYRRTYKEAYKAILGHDELRVKYSKLFEYEMNYIDHHLQRSKQQLIIGNVLTRSEYLVCHFILELAGNLHDLDINEKTFNAKFDFNLVYEFINRFDFMGLLKKMKEVNFKYYTTLLIYINMMRSVLNERDDASYIEFKKTVFENYDKISRHEAYNLLNNLETCCLNRRKYDPQKYETEIYEVYSFMLAKENYSYYGRDMGLQRYKNILVNFTHLKKFDEVENFVRVYINRVSPSLRDNLYVYSMALIEFSRNNFAEALKLLQKIQYDYFTLKYDVKNLTLRIYYELKYYENAYSLIDSYRHFLLKNKSVSEFYRERSLNFLGVMNSLLKYTGGERESEIASLRSNILNIQNVVSRSWLLEKIDELERKV